MTRQEVAYIFASTLQSKRNTLSGLFGAALVDWEKHQDLGRQADAIRRAGMPQPHALSMAQTAKTLSAQDAGNAFAFNVDATLKRCWADAGLPKDQRDKGIELYPGADVTLNSAFIAVVDQARHLQDPIRGKSLWSPLPEVFAKLGLDPNHASAACLFVLRLQQELGSYDAVEQRIIDNCKAVLGVP